MPPRVRKLRGGVLQRALLRSAEADKVHRATQTFVKQFSAAKTLYRQKQSAEASVHDLLCSTADYEGKVTNLHLAFDEIAEQTWQHLVRRGQACLERYAALSAEVEAANANVAACEGSEQAETAAQHAQKLQKRLEDFDDKECLLEHSFGQFLDQFSSIRKRYKNSKAFLPLWPPFLGLPHGEECDDEVLEERIKIAFGLEESDAGRNAFQSLFCKQANVLFPGGRARLDDGTWPTPLMQAANRIYKKWHQLLVSLCLIHVYFQAI
jgi:hypothetical protein